MGQKKPNPWGLYDMHGNVREWCEDVWHDNYQEAPTDGSAWVTGGQQSWHLLRGGSWGWSYNSPHDCRSASRKMGDLWYNLDNGFRLSYSS